MGNLKIDDLPGEILRQVCHYLDTASLSAFSFSNKLLRSFTFPVLCDTITIYVWDSDSLKAEVDGWRDVLNPSHGHSFIRIFRIKNGTPHRKGRPKRIQEVDEVPLSDAGELKDWSEHIVPQLAERNVYPGNLAGIEPEGVWTPAINLMQQLPGLQRIVYSCTDIPPSFITDLLEQMQYKCCFDSLNVDIPYERGKIFDDSLQLGVAKYSQRISLKVCGLTLAEAESEGYYRALRRLDQILQTSKDASEAYIWWCVPETIQFVNGFPDYSRAPQVMREIEELELGTIQASFHLLSLRLDACDGQDCLDYWSRKVDFTQLRTLKVQSLRGSQIVSWLSESCAIFESLESLVFDLDPLDESGPIFNASLGPELTLFLESIRPLQRLRLENSCGPTTIRVILDRHGKTLRQLWLKDSFDTIMLEVMCSKCTSLENLRFTLGRSKGDEIEVASYKILGGLPKLRRLHLDLDSTQPYAAFTLPDSSPASTFTHSQIDEKHCRMSEDCIRDIFISSAVDEQLVQSIFEIIQSGKSFNATPLESLTLEVVPATLTNISMISCRGAVVFLSVFRKVFNLTRDQRDTHQNEIIIKELNTFSDSELNESYDIKRMDDCSCKLIIQHLWPATEEGGRWWERLHSFPLARDDGIGNDAPLSQHEQLIFRRGAIGRLIDAE